MLDKLMPRGRVQVLRVLLVDPSQNLHLREVARRAGVSLQAVQREIHLLGAIGLVEATVVGRQKFLAVDQRHPLFPELRGLVIKTVGVVEPLRAALKAAKGVVAAAVFGSVAAGTDAGASDIDLLVVGGASPRDVHRALRVAEGRLSRPVNATVMSTSELRKRKGRKDPFIGRILAGPLLVVIGDVSAV